MEKIYYYCVVVIAMALAATTAGAIVYFYFHDPQVPPALVPNSNDTLLLTGDTPDTSIIPVTDILNLTQKDVVVLKARDGTGQKVRGVPVLDFLAAYGVKDFDRLVFYADDYEVTIDRDNVTNETVLEPYGYSVRVQGSNLPINAGIKNVRSIVVIGGNASTPILMNGKPVSYGSLLDDGIDTMVYSRISTGYLVSGKEYDVGTGYLASGIRLRDALFREGYQDFANVSVSGGGRTENLTRAQVLGGDYMLTLYGGGIKLAMVDENPMHWAPIDTMRVT